MTGKGVRRLQDPRQSPRGPGRVLNADLPGLPLQVPAADPGVPTQVHDAVGDAVLLVNRSHPVAGIPLGNGSQVNPGALSSETAVPSSKWTCSAPTQGSSNASSASSGTR